jgi:hypothetical protein
MLNGSLYIQFDACPTAFPSSAQIANFRRHSITYVLICVESRLGAVSYEEGGPVREYLLLR